MIFLVRDFIALVGHDKEGLAAEDTSYVLCLVESGFAQTVGLSVSHFLKNHLYECVCVCVCLCVCVCV